MHYATCIRLQNHFRRRPALARRSRATGWSRFAHPFIAREPQAATLDSVRRLLGTEASVILDKAST
jgi:hypothetical protein